MPRNARLPNDIALRLAACAALSCLVVRDTLGQAAPRPTPSDEANNPLTPKTTINFQDQWAPSLYDIDGGSNAFLFRGVIPNQLFGRAQLLRFTLPISTVPAAAGLRAGQIASPTEK